MAIIAAHDYRDGRVVSEPLDQVDEPETEIQSPDAFAWVGLFDPTPEEMAVCARRFRLHPLSVKDALHARQIPKRSHTARTAGRLTFGDLLVRYERFQVLDALHGEGHNAVFVFQAVDPDQAVFGIHAERKVGDFVFGFVEIPSDEADGLDGMDLVDVGHQAARARRVLRQFHGRSSSRRLTGWSAVRARMSASQAWGSTSLSRQVWISE